ncbi:MAG: hypothetical protein ACW98D_19490 [Promethearchaeota archaeon]
MRLDSATYIGFLYHSGHSSHMDNFVNFLQKALRSFLGMLVYKLSRRKLLLRHNLRQQPRYMSPTNLRV